MASKVAKISASKSASAEAKEVAEHLTWCLVEFLVAPHRYLPLACMIITSHALRGLAVDSLGQSIPRLPPQRNRVVEQCLVTVVESHCSFARRDRNLSARLGSSRWNLFRMFGIVTMVIYFVRIAFCLNPQQNHACYRWWRCTLHGSNRILLSFWLFSLAIVLVLAPAVSWCSSYAPIGGLGQL